MTDVQRTYLPAATRDWALPLYDPLVKLLGVERTRKILVDQARLRPKDRVLEIGCGTGSLVVLIKRLHPDVEVVVLDPDPKALARAGRKAERAEVSIQFDRGFSFGDPKKVCEGALLLGHLPIDYYQAACASEGT